MTSQEQRDKVLRMMRDQNTTLEISGQLGIPLREPTWRGFDGLPELCRQYR